MTAPSAQERVALMFVEAVWWQCHGALISNYLKIRAMLSYTCSRRALEEHPYTSAAQVWRID